MLDGRGITHTAEVCCYCIPRLQTRGFSFRLANKPSPQSDWDELQLRCRRAAKNHTIIQDPNEALAGLAFSYVSHHVFGPPWRWPSIWKDDTLRSLRAYGCRNLYRLRRIPRFRSSLGSTGWAEYRGVSSMEHSLLLLRGQRLQRRGEIGIVQPAWFCCFRELLPMVAGASWPTTG